MRRRYLGCALFALLCAVPVAAQHDKTVTLHLSDGTILTGELVEETDDSIKIHTRFLGDVVIERRAIAERDAGPPAMKAAQAAAPPASTPSPSPAAAAAPASAGPTWTRTFGLAGSYSSAPYLQGPIEGSVAGISGKDLRLPGSQLSAQAMLNLARTTVKASWFLNASMTYVNAEPTGRLTEAVAFDTLYTHAIDANDFYFTRFGYKSDVVRNVDNDIVQAFGVGRRMVDRPRFRIDVMPGIEFRRQQSGTRFDGKVLAGVGFMETITASNKRGIGFSQQMIFRTHLRHADLFSISNYLGINAPITPRIALTVGLTNNYDRMLGLQELVIPAGSFGPGTPEARFFANNRMHTQLTSGLQLRF